MSRLKLVELAAPMCDNAHMSEIDTKTGAPDGDTPEIIRERVRSTLQRYLADNLVRIVIDATHPGVLVPLKHKANERLQLNLSFRFEGHRMAYDRDAFRVTMIFDGANFRVTIPYEAFIAAQPIPREEPPAKKISHLKIVK